VSLACVLCAALTNAAAYFTQATFDQLGTVDDLPRVRDVVVPEGTFKSTRVSKSRGKTDDGTTGGRSTGSGSGSGSARTFAPFPSPYQYHHPAGSPSLTPVLMHEPYQQTSSPSSFNDAPSPTYHPQQSPSPVSPPVQPQFFQNTQYQAQYYSLSPSYSPQYQQQPLQPQPVTDPLRTVPQYRWPNNNDVYRAQDQLHSYAYPHPAQTYTPTHSPPPDSNVYPSYSLHSALTPPPPQIVHAASDSLPISSGPTPTLSPLTIPTRNNLPANYGPSPVEFKTEETEVSLPPLEQLQRQTRWPPRGEQDEHALRRLHHLYQTTP